MKTNYPKLFVLCLVLFTLACVSSVSALYNPTAGRWLSRDPIEERSGPPLQCFVNNSPISGWDIDGRLVFGLNPLIRPNPEIYRCGGFKEVWAAIYQGLPNCRGYSVLKLTITGDIYDCQSRRKGVDVPTFWERTPLFTNSPNSTVTSTSDTQAQPSRFRRYGTVRIEGEFRFYCESQTGDLSGWKANESLSIDGTLIPTQPMTTTEPTFWQTQSAEGVATFSIFSEWDCCFCDVIGPRNWVDNSQVLLDWSPR